MIALTERRRKGVQKQRKPPGRAATTGISIHGIVSGILLLPHFRQPRAPLGCDKKILRWPGPFGSGFLSPQPPGAVGIGPVRRGSSIPILGQRELVLFRLRIRFKDRSRSSLGTTKSVTCRRLPQRHPFRKFQGRTSAAQSSPRRASRPAFRGCRPGYRPPQHRRPRGRYSPAERSSFPRRRSSPRPSRDCARRCSR
jgi:hypothetical protein